jgi:hypothetical protein
LVLGNTAPFVRVADSAVNKENKPLSLDNVFIGGKWKSQIPSMSNTEMVSECKADGMFFCGFPNVSRIEGFPIEWFCGDHGEKSKCRCPDAPHSVLTESRGFANVRVIRMAPALFIWSFVR